MKTIKLLSAALLFACLSSTAQTVVLPYIPGTTTEGVTYYLPQTELSYTVTATCTKKKPGELNSYAGRYLKLNDVTKAEETHWEINEISITPFGTPDTSKVYSIPLKKATLAPLVNLTKSGILLSINASTDETPLPVDPKINKFESNALNSKDYLTQEILYAGNSNKMAELSANEIYDIRESRSELSKGQAENMPKDGEQLKLMIQQLNLQEEALLQLFKGTEERTTQSFTFIYKPTKSTKGEILFRFSDKLGIVDKNNLAGEPIYIDVLNQKTIPAEQIDPKKKKADEQAVRYNLSSDATIKLYSRDKVFVELNTPIAQFGRVEILSSELFNKRTATQVFFNQNTGSLIRIVDETGGK